MLPSPVGSPRIATALLLGLLAATPAVGQVELELPAPAAPTTVRAIAVRAELSARPDGAHDAVVRLTVLNPEAESLRLALTPGGPYAAVTRAGEPVRLQEDGSFELRMEASEVAVLQVRRRVRASQAAFLPAERAGWLGQARGPLLQPVQVLRLAHPEGSSWADAALEVVVEPGGRLLASSLMTDPGAVALEDGRVSWSFAAGRAPAEFGLAWPLVETESLLPTDAAEAEVFSAHWTRRRGLEAGAARRVRLGLLAAHGGLLDSVEDRRDFSPERRPGWAFLPGPPGEDVLAAARVLEDLERRLELAGEPRVAAVTPAAPPAAPTAAPPASEPARTEAPARAAAQPPPGPTARNRGPAAPTPRPAPDLSAADDDPLVVTAPDSTWRQENLLQTESSVPSTADRARRWARRAVRGGHGVSRAVLARESVPALHGKTWAPGYVSEFFRAREWYEPNEGFSIEDLSGEERAAYERLDELVRALQDGREWAPEPEELVASSAPPPSARPDGSAAAATPQAPAPRRESDETPPTPEPTASDRTATGGPAVLGDVPWLQNPAQARIFVFREKAKGLDAGRVQLAIATIEARHGKPFDSEPSYRRHFEATDWYRPQPDYGPERLSIPARESITLLRAALEARTW